MVWSQTSWEDDNNIIKNYRKVLTTTGHYKLCKGRIWIALGCLTVLNMVAKEYPWSYLGNFVYSSWSCNWHVLLLFLYLNILALIFHHIDLIFFLSSYSMPWMTVHGSQLYSLCPVTLMLYLCTIVCETNTIQNVSIYIL